MGTDKLCLAEVVRQADYGENRLQGAGRTSARPTITVYRMEQRHNRPAVCRMLPNEIVSMAELSYIPYPIIRRERARGVKGPGGQGDEPLIYANERQ